VLHSRSFTSRPWLVAVAGLILTAAITVPFFFVTRLAEQLAIAAVLSLAVAAGAWLLAKRLDRRGQQLVDAERKYRDLTDGLPIIPWIYGAKDRNDTRLVGPQIEATVGYSPEQWDGELLERILHPDDRDRVLDGIAAAVEQGVPFESEYRVLARNGEVVWLREHARIVSGSRGEPRVGQSFLVDISERKHAEMSATACSAPSAPQRPRRSSVRAGSTCSAKSRTPLRRPTTRRRWSGSPSWSSGTSAIGA
jgi:PAS domain S-box-containing protein